MHYQKEGIDKTKKRMDPAGNCSFNTDFIHPLNECRCVTISPGTRRILGSVKWYDVRKVH